MLTGLYYKVSELMLGLFSWLPSWSMPANITDGLSELISYMYRLNEFLPVYTLFRAFLLVISYFAVARIWNFLADIIGLVRGVSTPKI